MSWLEPVEIRTPRLILRSARPDDLAAMHAILSDPRATRWWSTPPHETLDQTAAWLDGMIANGPDHPDFVVELDGRVIGKAGFYRMPDVGYILHPDVWGQGLASEAVGAAIDHVFHSRDVDLLTADVDPENAASIRLLERLGFIRTGSAERTWNVGGVWKDSVFYALSRADRAAGVVGQAPA
ncbi:MAG: GNAT family N-acetyltransferase [Brevundimonas sp.]|nr:GNAT family N-acetyltransferase [Brevundimonas sp.]MDO9076753.1 GNAT family N-acetyltransferase [Brevundimonas sp.]